MSARQDIFGVEEYTMKKTYIKPEADKIAFNYRDQVVAASSTESGGGSSFLENFVGFGSPLCGSGGIWDRVADYATSIKMCD